jgi:recombinational DNA repair protein (RecF pathway)
VARAGRSRTGFGAEPQARQALVLAHHDAGDDRIVELFVQDLGRLRAVAPRARKSVRRFGAHVEPLTLTEVVLRTRPDWELARLDRAAAVRPFAVVKADMLRLALGLSMAETVLMVLAEHDHDPDLYDLTLRAWTRLDDPATPVGEDLLLLFELKTLQFVGLLPDLRDFEPLPPETRAILAGGRLARRALAAAAAAAPPPRGPGARGAPGRPRRAPAAQPRVPRRGAGAAALRGVSRGPRVVYAGAPCSSHRSRGSGSPPIGP